MVVVVEEEVVVGPNFSYDANITLNINVFSASLNKCFLILLSSNNRRKTEAVYYIDL